MCGCGHRGLSKLITAILGGLMENDLNKIMEFNEFFKEIERIHRKKVDPLPVHIEYTRYN